MFSKVITEMVKVTINLEKVLMRYLDRRKLQNSETQVSVFKNYTNFLKLNTIPSKLFRCHTNITLDFKDFKM